MDNEEAKLVERCQRGELQYFGALYDGYVKKIYNFIYFRTHHRETAEDLTSVVFTKALEKISGYDAKKGAFSSWLYQIARNSIIDHYRTSRQTSSIEDAWDLPSSSNVERDVDTASQLEKVSQYLTGLDSRQRDIVIMRVWDGLSHREIAEVLGISEASSKMTFSRVMGKLNKDMVVAMVLLIAARGL